MFFRWLPLGAQQVLHRINFLIVLTYLFTAYKKNALCCCCLIIIYGIALKVCRKSWMRATLSSAYVLVISRQ